MDKIKKGLGRGLIFVDWRNKSRASKKSSIN